MEKQKNIPQLRFPGFDINWALKRTKEIAPLQRGFDLPTTDVIIGEYPVVYSNGILRYHHKFKIVAPGVVTGRSGTIGTVTYVEKDYWPHNTSLWVTDFKGNDPKFIYYFYTNFKLDRFNAGSTVPTLNRNDVHILKKNIPTLPEQQKIAAFLTAVDGRIGRLKKKKALLEQYKKGVMQQIFSRQIRFKQDDGSDFPEWVEKKLGELTFKVGKKNTNGEDLPIYSINNKDGFVPQGEQFEGMDSNKRGYDISLYKVISKKTFAYNPARINVGSIGFSGDLDNVIISSLYVCFKTNSLLNDSFLMVFLKSDKFHKEVLRNAEGGVREYLFYDNFAKIKFEIPSIKEQTKIANFLSAIDEKINQCNTQIEKTELWKKGLLQQMFV